MTRSSDLPNRDFRLLAVAATGSRLGDGVYATGMYLLAAAWTHEAVLVAMVAVASYIPWLLFGVPAGLLLDAVPRRRLFVIAETLRGCVLGGFVVAAVIGTRQIAVLLVTVFLVGSLGTVSDTALDSLMPEVVKRSDLTRANAKLSLGQNVALRLAGAPLGGVLYSLLAWLPFGIDALSFFWSALLIDHVRGSAETWNASRADPGDRKPVLREQLQRYRVGVSWMRQADVTRAMLSTVVLMNVASGIVSAVLVLFAERALHLSGTEYGLLGGALGVGVIAGVMIAGRSKSGSTVGLKWCRAAALIQAVALVGLWLSSGFAAAMAALAVFGVATGTWNVFSMSFLQAAIPADLRGRVFSTYRTIATVAAPVGALIGGVIAGLGSVRESLLASAVVLGVAAAYAFARLVERASSSIEDLSPAQVKL